MAKDDKHNALLRVLKEKCPEAIEIVEDDDIKKLVAAGFFTAAALTGVPEGRLDTVLPGRPGVVWVLLKAFGQPAGAIRRREWLNQKLPRLLYGRSSYASSSSGFRAYRYWPDSTKLWDLSRDVDAYLADAATKDSYHKSIDMEVTVNTTPVRTEAASQSVYDVLLKQDASACLVSEEQPSGQRAMKSAKESLTEEFLATETKAEEPQSEV